MNGFDKLHQVTINKSYSRLQCRYEKPEARKIKNDMFGQMHMVGMRPVFFTYDDTANIR